MSVTGFPPTQTRTHSTGGIIPGSSMFLRRPDISPGPMKIQATTIHRQAAGTKSSSQDEPGFANNDEPNPSRQSPDRSETTEREQEIQAAQLSRRQTRQFLEFSFQPNNFKKEEETEIRANFSVHENLGNAGKTSTDCGRMDEKFRFSNGNISRNGLSSTRISSARNWADDEQIRELRKFSDVDDGADSDSSSDLFDLPNHDLDFYSNGLPVYGTTNIDRIRIGAPVS
ncbi:UNVERIFIED_CONTAM: protein BIG GRAIN 1-like E [Sesamum angustifolium]|uniref:Protein BIG GRAIN 1-like E n=1 Tax=Sesamum angustifolium TaxID=2727405 RepID=A0AAW2RJX6_9LAMI